MLSGVIVKSGISPIRRELTGESSKKIELRVETNPTAKPFN